MVNTEHKIKFLEAALKSALVALDRVSAGNKALCQVMGTDDHAVVNHPFIDFNGFTKEQLRAWLSIDANNHK